MNHIPVAAPIDSDSAGRGGAVAINAVMRVVCQQTNSVGTGFLHKSGFVITAEHVVRGCPNPALVPSSLAAVPATVKAVDPALDLAILAPATPIAAAPLPLSSGSQFSIGAHVSTWGYPGGYGGAAPMLSAGYLAALDGRQAGGQTIKQWVVNAAFNSGNSGGPLLLIETGEVIGVVSSKLAPMSPYATSALQALQGQSSGFTYTQRLPDGSTRQLSEGQVVAAVLDDLRRQVQLVIGYAVLLDDLRAFLTSQGVSA
jgi:S1-C subfamily serine protease